MRKELRNDVASNLKTLSNTAVLKLVALTISLLLFPFGTGAASAPGAISQYGTELSSFPTGRTTVETSHGWERKFGELNEFLGIEDRFSDGLVAFVAPSISSISPSSPRTSVTDQNIRVNGSNFVSGLTVTVTFPSGGTGTLSGSQIVNVTSSSFTMRITLNATGTWRIRVNNPNGEMSGQFQFNVSAAVAPAISSISPSSPTISNSNQNVVVNGSNFQDGLTVTVFFPGGGSGTLSGTQITNVSTTSFTMVVTLNVLGTYGIRVNNPSNLQSNTFNFATQQPTPTISGISPSGVCAQNGDRTFAVSGSNFVSGLTVTVFFPSGGSTILSGSQIQFISSTSFNMIVTLNVVGTYNFRVNNPGGAQSANRPYNTQDCNPSISSISPSSPVVSNSNQTVAVSGTNFQSGLTVTVFFPGGGSGTLQGSQIQFNSSASFNMIVTLNVFGPYQIRVNNPNGTVSTNFSFNTQNAPPTISSVSPTTPCVRNVDQSIVVNGTNFVSGLTVTVFFPGGGSGTLSGTQIQSVTSTSFTMIVTLGEPGTYGLRVNNPSGAPSATFSMPTQNCLNVSGINPTSPTQSNVDQNIVVNGNGFLANLSVIVTLPDLTTVTLSGAQIVNVTTGSFTMKITLNGTGTWKIKVRNPNGDLSNLFSFTVQPPIAPSVSALNPSSPTASNVDQNVVVTGSNFQTGLTVTLTFPGGGTGTLSGTQIQNVTGTSFTMRATFGGAGAWSMRVNNSNGGQSAPFGFTVLSNVQAPVIYSINPTTPIARGTDQDVVVSGSNFQQNLQVPITFPGGGGTTLSGAQIQNVTSTSFIMRATLSSAGSWTIKVQNPDGGLSAPYTFTVNNGTNPIINTINPTTPTSSGADQNVTVNGGNFQSGLRVNVTFPNGGVGTLQGTGQIQNVTANSFIMRITLNDTGTWTIRVLNPNGSQSGQFQFTVNASGPPPTGLPTSVLSPVIGPLRQTTSNQGIADGKWEFNQHKTGYHTATGGISSSNDTYAWDANLYTATSGNADGGRAVFATAAGQVVSYIGISPGGGPGAVLIAHPNAAAPTWFSGYLHLNNVRVTTGQFVDISSVLGDVGRVGAGNDHLHFVIYSGSNTRGNLRSFNATITERQAGTNVPTIASITPGTVNQGPDPQLVTISGANFQPNSILEVQDPNGNFFTVTPESVSGFEQESRIINSASTSITARIAFAAGGNYEFAVINRPVNASLVGAPSASFAVSSPNTVYSVPSGRTPVIIIPGIMGSRVGRRQTNGDFQELWPASIQSGLHFVLADDVEDPSNYRPLSARNVVATEVIRNINIGGYPIKDFYGNLIDYLRTRQGYTLDPATYPTLGQCNESRNNADLFVFPYDWRNSNLTSARDLWYFVQCIRNIRGNPANFKVHIIAHSMGGLVARRYVLDNPETHSVERMVTLGTPWLGAPKFMNVLEHGGKLWDYQSVLILPTTIKQIAPQIKGAHELIPSRAYDDGLAHLVLGENGWNDFDYHPQQTPWFTFDRVKTVMNLRYPPNNPGTRTDTFHNQPGQDLWSADNLHRVDYYNFVGYGRNTIGSLVAMVNSSGNQHLQDYPASPAGDGTVPLSSALRYRPNRPDLPNYRGPIRLERGFNLDHTELVSKASHESTSTHPFVGCVVNWPNAEACISSQSLARGLTEPEDFVGDPNYLMKVIGSESVLISDSFGNTTNPLSTSIDEGVPTVKSDVTSDKYVSSSFPLDQTYRATIRVPSTPFSIILTKSDGQIITQAIRYVDITLPASVFAMIQISPQGVTTLAYDSNGDGTFDTPVNPTIVVTGAQAQDSEPPQLNINETVSGGNSRIELEATDTGTGVQRIMYSLNGTTFQPYSTPLTLNPATTPTIYAYADDNVFNRSGLVSFNLTTSNAGYSVSGPISAPSGGSAVASWNAPTGRPVDDWIGLFRVGTRNSAFVSKQYTGGSTTGSLSFTLPNQAGTYEFRYLLSDGYSSVAASSPFAVGFVTRPSFDFDGDGKSDISIFRPANGQWWLNRSSAGLIVHTFGSGSDILTPGDFTGDGTADVAIFRPSNGQWYVLRSGDFSFYSFPFGTTGDVPVPGDYDGDGKTDAAVFRPSNATWYIQRSSGGTTIQTFGASTDRPVPADYDGDGKTDIAIYRPSLGQWWMNRSTAGLIVHTFGNSADKAVPGDYTGDGKADVAIWRPSTGEWFILRSEDASFYSFPFGISTDLPVPGDYDGDGRMDAGVFRSSNGTWYLNRSTAGTLIQGFGIGTDTPVPYAFVR